MLEQQRARCAGLEQEVERLQRESAQHRAESTEVPRASSNPAANPNPNPNPPLLHQPRPYPQHQPHL